VVVLLLHVVVLLLHTMYLRVLHRVLDERDQSVGDLTISLDDVWSLIHLPITGEFCPNEPLDYKDSIETLMTLVGVDQAMTSVELNHCRGVQVRLSWLRDLYTNCCKN